MQAPCSSVCNFSVTAPATRNRQGAVEDTPVLQHCMTCQDLATSPTCTAAKVFEYVMSACAMVSSMIMMQQHAAHNHRPVSPQLAKPANGLATAAERLSL